LEPLLWPGVGFVLMAAVTRSIKGPARLRFTRFDQMGNLIGTRSSRRSLDGL